MDDSMLTSQAIAELMRDIETQSQATGPQERKVNPLGKPNKSFLGRTIKADLSHNRRESERTQAHCKQKLQEMDERYERRKTNRFYNRRPQRSRSRSSSHSRSRSPSSSRRSRKRKHKKKHKKHKKHKKSKPKRRSRNSSTSSSFSQAEEEREPKPRPSLAAPILPSTELFLQHSKHMALAVAMAYNQALYAQSSKEELPKEPRVASPMSDIVKELMSDDDDEEPHLESLSVDSSSENEQDILTIEVDTDEDSSEDSTASESNSGSCIALDDSTTDGESDLEIIECEPKQQEEEQPLVEHSASADQQQLVSESTTVDLTED